MLRGCLGPRVKTLCVFLHLVVVEGACLGINHATVRRMGVPAREVFEGFGRRKSSHVVHFFVFAVLRAQTEVHLLTTSLVVCETRALVDSSGLKDLRVGVSH